MSSSALTVFHLPLCLPLAQRAIQPYRICLVPIGNSADRVPWDNARAPARDRCTDRFLPSRNARLHKHSTVLALALPRPYGHGYLRSPGPGRLEGRICLDKQQESTVHASQTNYLAPFPSSSTPHTCLDRILGASGRTLTSVPFLTRSYAASSAKSLSPPSSVDRDPLVADVIARLCPANPSS